MKKETASLLLGIIVVASLLVGVGVLIWGTVTQGIDKLIPVLVFGGFIFLIHSIFWLSKKANSPEKDDKSAAP